MTGQDSGAQVRVGVLGTDSTHVDAFLRHLNIEQRHPELRITAALACSPERDAAITAWGAQILGTPAAVVARTDVVLVTERDPGQHVPLARLALSAGRKVFIDKPLADTPQGAHQVRDLAPPGRLATGSTFQHHPVVLDSALRRPQHVVVEGPADPRCPWGGLLFYGIHAAEAACRVLAGDDPRGRVMFTDIRRSERADRTIVTARGHAGNLELHLHHQPPGAAPFVLECDGRRQELTLPSDYLAPVTRAIHDLAVGNPTTSTLGVAEAALELLVPEREESA